MSSSGRQYDIVLYGATGYTGKLTASHMAMHLPTDIKWAISGRSESKLEAVAATCKALNPDRIHPGKAAIIQSIQFYFPVSLLSSRSRFIHITSPIDRAS